MYNRYNAATGAVRRVEERKNEHSSAPEMPPRHQSTPAVEQRPKPKPKPKPTLGALAELLPKKLSALETEDIILMLILYLMYRESGDSELLIIMGAMFFL